MRIPFSRATVYVNMDFGGGHSEGGFDWSGLFDGKCFKCSFCISCSVAMSLPALCTALYRVLWAILLLASHSISGKSRQVSSVVSYTRPINARACMVNVVPRRQKEGNIFICRLHAVQQYSGGAKSVIIFMFI